MADPVVAGRLPDLEPSPQSTEKALIVPVPPGSGSVAVKDTVTAWAVVAGLGERLVMVTVGDMSSTSRSAWPEPMELLLSVPVILMGKDLLATPGVKV